MPDSALHRRRSTGSVAVIGVGCILMGDDGAGPAAIESLARADLGPNVRLMDAGTALMDVLPETTDCDRVILVDACTAGREPGDVFRVPLDPGHWPAGPLGDSLHDLDIVQTLRLHQLVEEQSSEYVLIGIEPGHVGPGAGLSETVRARLPDLVRAVRDEIFGPPARPCGGGE